MLRQMLVVILVSLVSNLYAQWEQIGSLQGANVKVMAFRGDTIFAGGTHKIYEVFHTPEAHGIYRSTDNGETWKKMYSNDYEITALAFNEDVIFAGTSSGMLRSDDSGKTWLQTNLNGSIKSIFTANGYVLAGKDDGSIHKTTDNGINWVMVFNDPNITNSYISDIASNGSKLVAASANFNYIDLYESNDDGDTWSTTNISRISERYFTCELLFKGSKLFAATQGGVYESTDEGSSWSMLTTDIALKFTSIALDGNNLYLGTEKNGVLHSNDNGATWVPVNDGLGHYQAYVYSNQQGELFVGNFAGVYRSNNATIQWEQKNAGFPSYVASTILETGDNLYATTFGGIWTSADEGQTWQHDSRNSNDWATVDLAYWSDTLYVGSGSKLLQRPESESIGWMSTSIGGRITSFVPGSPNSYMLTTTNFYRRINNQGDWRLANIGLPSEGLVELVKIGETLIVNSGYHLYRSINGGDSWSKVEGSILNKAQIYDIEATDNYIYIARHINTPGAQTREVLRSDDQGATWKSVGILPWKTDYTTTGISYSEIATNDSLIVVSGGQGRIFISSHEHSEWHEINNGLPDGYIANITMLKDDLLATMKSGQIWTYPLKEHIAFPEAPSELAGSYGFLSNELTWKDNSDDETQFIIYRSRFDYADVLHPLDTVEANVTSYEDSDNNQAGDLFFYRVLATINGTNSAASNLVAIVKRGPSTPLVDLITESSFALWSFYHDRSDSVALDISTDNFKTFLPGYEGRVVAPDSMMVEDLLPEFNYSVRIRPYVKGYYGSYSDTVVVQLTPIAPTNFIAKDTDVGKTYFEWNDQSENENGFTVQIRELIDGELNDFYNLFSVGKDTTFHTYSYPEYSIYLGIDYEFRVVAFNDGGKAYSDTFRMIPPTAPTNFSVLNAGPYRLHFDWTDNSDNEAGFAIEYRYSESDPYQILGRVGADTTSITMNTDFFRSVPDFSGSSL